MNKNQILTIIFFILLLGLLILKITDNNGNNQQAKVNQPTTTKSDTKTDVNSQEIIKTFGRVEVGAKLKQVEAGKPIIITLSLNNHQISLDQDLTKITQLSDESGTKYLATDWSGGKGGHHLRGDLIFEKLDKMPKKLVMKISKIDGTSNEYTWSFEKQAINNDTTDYQNISPDQLKKMLSKKDFKLIDVHIPEQEHIPGTDKMIAFNKINDLVKEIGPDKNKKVVLYCRSGSMSQQAANALTKKGYKNVYNLVGGMNNWLKNDGQSLPIGSLN